MLLCVFQTVVEELEQRLEQCHAKGMDEEATAQKASKAKTAAGKNTKTPGEC